MATIKGIQVMTRRLENLLKPTAKERQIELLKAKIETDTAQLAKNPKLTDADRAVLSSAVEIVAIAKDVKL